MRVRRNDDHWGLGSGRQSESRAGARVHAGHTFKQKHTSRRATVPRHYYLNPYANEPLRENETKVMRGVEMCVCVRARARFFSARCACIRTTHAHACARSQQRLRWPPRRRRWRRTEKGGRIKATQRNNQCSLRVIIPLLDRFDCFKGVTRRSSGCAVARHIFNNLPYHIIYLRAGRASRDGGPTAKEEVYRLKKSRHLATPRFLRLSYTARGSTRWQKTPLFVGSRKLDRGIKDDLSYLRGYF